MPRTTRVQHSPSVSATSSQNMVSPNRNLPSDNEQNANTLDMNQTIQALRLEIARSNELWQEEFRRFAQVSTERIDTVQRDLNTQLVTLQQQNLEQTADLRRNMAAITNELVSARNRQTSQMPSLLDQLIPSRSAVSPNNGSNNRPGSSAGSSQDRPIGSREGTLLPAPMHHLKALDFKTPSYCGSHDKQTPCDYLVNLQRVKKTLSYSDDLMLRLILPTSLKEDAFIWYDSVGEFESWADFEDKFSKEFQAVGYKETLRREIEDRFQGPDEPLTKYIRLMIKYYERLGDHTPEREILARIIRQMHPEYKMVLVGKRPETLNQLLDIAPEIQEFIRDCRVYRPPPITGTLEPSLAWKPGNHYQVTGNEAKVRSQYENPNIPEIHYSAVDPYKYYHKAKTEREVREIAPKTVQFQGSQSPTKEEEAKTSSVVRPPTPRADSFSKGESNRERRWSGGSGSSTMKCFNCHGPHYANECPHHKSPGRYS